MYNTGVSTAAAAISCKNSIFSPFVIFRELIFSVFFFRVYRLIRCVYICIYTFFGKFDTKIGVAGRRWDRRRGQKRKVVCRECGSESVFDVTRSRSTGFAQKLQSHVRLFVFCSSKQVMCSMNYSCRDQRTSLFFFICQYNNNCGGNPFFL